MQSVAPYGRKRACVQGLPCNGADVHRVAEQDDEVLPCLLHNSHRTRRPPLGAPSALRSMRLSMLCRQAQGASATQYEESMHRQ